MPIACVRNVPPVSVTALRRYAADGAAAIYSIRRQIHKTTTLPRSAGDSMLVGLLKLLLPCCAGVS